MGLKEVEVEMVERDPLAEEETKGVGDQVEAEDKEGAGDKVGKVAEDHLVVNLVINLVTYFVINFVTNLVANLVNHQIGC